MSARTKWFSKGLREITLPAGTALVRAHHKDRGPIFFGPAPGVGPTYRFDAPGGEFRVMYAAETLHGAFVEGVLHSTDEILAHAWLQKRRWSHITCQSDLCLAKVYDDGLLFHGVDAGVSAADLYAEPQAFALELHTRFPHVDGIAYRARHDNGELCYAIFDRAERRGPGGAPGAGPPDPGSGPSSGGSPVRGPTSPFLGGAPQDFYADPGRLSDMMELYGAVFDLSYPLPPI